MSSLAFKEGSLADFVRLEPVDQGTPETLFEKDWALTVLQRTVDRLRRDYESTGKGELFEELKAFLSEKQPRSHAEIAARHGISVSAVGVAVHRLRQRYGKILRNEIAQTVRNADEVNAEIRHLLRVLGG